MEFGRVPTDELSSIDFTLPPDHPQTKKVLGGKKATGAKVYVGCAKWGRPEWVGLIYPKGTKAADFLAHYAKHFNSIELNATFHQPHTRETIEKWADMTGKGFKFCPKVYQGVSHWKRLKDAQVETDKYIESIMGFGDKLGPVFLQVHDNFGLKSVEVLQEYLKTWPKEIALQLELRNTNWHIDSIMVDELMQQMQQLGIGFVLTDASGRRDVVHMRLTNSTAFIRWVGNSLHPTDYVRIDEWVLRIKEWLAAGIKEVYFLVHNHDEINTPVIGDYVVQKLNEVCGLKLERPSFIGKLL